MYLDKIPVHLEDGSIPLKLEYPRTRLYNVTTQKNTVIIFLSVYFSLNRETSCNTLGF